MNIQEKEKFAHRVVNKAAHFWLDDVWEIEIQTDNEATNSEQWSGSATLTPNMTYNGETPITLHLSISVKTPDEVDFELSEDNWASLDAETLFLKLYCDLMAEYGKLWRKHN